MDTVLFNFHDLVHILTAFECLLLASLLGANLRERSVSTYFFIGFLICHALIPLHELTFWGKQFRLWMLDISPNMFFIGSYAYFLDGALLYFFVRALLYKNFKLRRVHLLHAIPLLLYFIQMCFTFYRLDSDVKVELIESQHIAYSSPFLFFDAAGRYIRLLYAVFCVALIFNYGEQLKDLFANLNKRDLSWLKIMVYSFLLLFGWDALLLSIKLSELIRGSFDLSLLNVVGLTSYYLTFVVLNILIFLKFTRFGSVAKIDEYSGPEIDVDSKEDLDLETAARIKQYMCESKIYQMSDITVDKLASELKIPSKRLSQTIKQNFQLNFYEFINSFRIQEAQRLLIHPDYAGKTITEIYFEVGFNSKSVFNTFFKKTVKMTPSQFREQNVRESNKDSNPLKFIHMEEDAKR